MDTNVHSNNFETDKIEMKQHDSSPLEQRTALIGTSTVVKDGTASSPVDVPSVPTKSSEQTIAGSSWMGWFDALKQVFPVYLGTHLAFFVISCLAVLFTIKDFSGQVLPLNTIWQSWDRFDTTLFATMARYGYTNISRTALFPLYSLLERALMPLTHGNPFLAGLVISNLAGLGIFIVLYRLVMEDFNAEQAGRTVLYLALFPTAFYFASGYNESLFIFFAVCVFYEVRRGQWWLAGLFGLLASLTRSAGILLFVPFYYEYLRQHEFQLKRIRLDVLAGMLIPFGLALFAAWCYHQYHDPLAFSHAQKFWNRYLAFPGFGILRSMYVIERSGGLLSFNALRNMTDLLPDLFILLFILLSFVGPWRLPRRLWVYGIYAFVLYVFLQLFPNGGTNLFPLESVGRFMLEVFPAFIIMAAVGKNKNFHMSYLMVSGAILFFLLTQFLTGHWVL